MLLIEEEKRHDVLLRDFMEECLHIYTRHRALNLRREFLAYREVALIKRQRTLLRSKLQAKVQSR